MPSHEVLIINPAEKTLFADTLTVEEAFNQTATVNQQTGDISVGPTDLHHLLFLRHQVKNHRLNNDIPGESIEIVDFNAPLSKRDISAPSEPQGGQSTTEVNATSNGLEGPELAQVEGLDLNRLLFMQYLILTKRLTDNIGVITK